MANTPETMATTEAFKNRYQNGIKNPIPSSSKVQQMLDFKKADKIGDKFMWSVSLALPHGHTWNGGANYGGGIALNDAQAGKILMAEARGCEYYNRSEIPHGVLTKGETNGQVVMAPIMDVYMSRLVEATSHGLEVMSLYGGLSMGTIGVVGANGGTAVFVATISEATWAAGLFKCSEGMPIDIYEAGTGDAPGAAKRTATGAAKITAINTNARQITITLAAVGDYANIVPTDVIVPFNSKDNWANGIDQIVTTSASGANVDVLGINCSQNSLWRASTFAAAGAMSLTKFLQATVQLSINASDTPSFEEGSRDEPYVFLCSPYTQIDLITEQAALRRYTEESEIKKLRAGGAGLILDTPVGPVKVVSSSYVKAGQAFFLRPSDWHYVGSSMPTFGSPASLGGEVIAADPNRNTYRVMRYFDLAPMADVLNGTLKVTGIDNASLS
jgi:hypothetical protein